MVAILFNNGSHNSITNIGSYFKGSLTPILYVEHICVKTDDNQK